MMAISKELVELGYGFGAAVDLVYGYIRKKAHKLYCEPLGYSVGESNPYCKIENLEY